MQWHACQQESGRHQDIIWWHIMLNFREGKKQVDWLRIKEGSTMLARMTRDIFYRKKKVSYLLLHHPFLRSRGINEGKEEREGSRGRVRLKGRRRKKELQIRTEIENSMCPDVQSPQEWRSRSKEWKEFRIIKIFFSVIELLGQLERADLITHYC